MLSTIILMAHRYSSFIFNLKHCLKYQRLLSQGKVTEIQIRLSYMSKQIENSCGQKHK